MTTADAASAITPGEAVAARSAASHWLTRAEGYMERIGEWLNPILVKECRQALKSRQFVITFSLLLLCGWGWSIIGVAFIGPDIYFSFSGPEMFYGYYVVLSFPLLVIVPFCAFRSLASEREDHTFELVSITTLKPRQIVGGKLGSAVLQMIVYFSAISPCLAFTYMLRGIDVVTIVLILVYAFMASLGLSLLSLLIATLTSEKHWQAVLSVVLILGLAFLFIMGLMLAYSILESAQSVYGDADFWYGNLALLTGYVAYFALFYLTAAAQLTFASDNRSTPLRIVMVGQFLLFTAWMAWVTVHYWPSIQSVDITIPLVIYLSFCGLHWYVMGAFMSGEWPYLSPRVKRQLPQSFFGRTFLTWFNPGPGTGLLFALGNLLTALLLVLTVIFVWFGFNGGAAAGGGPKPEQVVFFGLIGYCYVAIYLGIGKLLVSLSQRLAAVGIVMTVLVQILLLLLGCGVPLIVQLMSSDLRNSGYSLLHITDPFWTLAEVVDRNTLYGPAVLALVAPVAALVMLCNLPAIAAEVRHVRVAKPQRVAEEDATLAAELAPVQPVRHSPWD